MPALVHLFAPAAGEWNGAALHVVRSLLLLHAAVRTGEWLLTASELKLPVAAIVAVGVLMALAAVGGALRRFGRAAALLGAGVVLVQVIASFPGTKDDVYLQLCCLALCALLDADDPDDGPLLRSALCWMGVLVLFHSGLQKLLHGYYFQGETLLTGVAGRDPLAQSLQWLLASGEVQRLMQFRAAVQGAGPFQTESTSFVLVSNALWLVPMVLAALTVFRRTRAFAASAAIAFVVLLNVPAHEIMAGLLLSQLLLLCIPGEWNRRLAWIFVVAYAGIALGYISVVAVPLWKRWGQP